MVKQLCLVLLLSLSSVSSEAQAYRRLTEERQTIQRSTCLRRGDVRPKVVIRTIREVVTQLIRLIKAIGRECR
jgi:hypothetical protein